MKPMIKLETTAKVSAAILLSFASLAVAQVRPAPEPAPTLELPEENEGSGNSESRRVDILGEGEETPAFETEVEVIVGDNESKMVRWPSKREVPEGQVILAFDDVAVTETFTFIAETTGKIIIPIKKMGMNK